MPTIFRSFSLFCRRAFFEADTKTYTVVNDSLAVIIIVSILVIILESVGKFSDYLPIFLLIEYVAVGIFTIEYICRIIGSEKKLSYIFSFFGLIDLISILPTWLHLVNLTPLKSARSLRILRLLRTARLAKLSHFDHTKKHSKKSLKSVLRLNLQIYFSTFIISVVLLGTLAYVFEHNNPYFANIPLSMLWILESIFGGSISSAQPETYTGIIIFMLARFLSFILLGFLVHIIGNIISYLLLGEKTDISIKP